MSVPWSDERGQSVVAFGIMATIFFMLTVGLVDVGRAFYEYNAVASAARFASRWASVVGGVCATYDQGPTSDWCNQVGQSGMQFWSQSGNAPLQTNGASCPPTYNEAQYSSDYYAASSSSGASATTIVGAVAQRFDSSNTNPGFVGGALSPGLDLNKLKVCIELPQSWDAAHSPPMYIVKRQDPVGVFVYYPFSPISPLVTSSQFTLIASAHFQVE